jgi:predicted transposase YbfD/YdcC
MARQKPTLTVFFSRLEDPRVTGRTVHRLLDILVITICAVLSGAESWVDVEMYGKEKREFLRKYLRLPHGIPSHDTFGRVFSLIHPEKIQECFIEWVQSAMRHSKGEIIAIDGKTVRRSFDNKKGIGALHMISAWATANGVVLGQRKCDEKSNEITAIPELLRLLDIHGCIVTTDAMGCQKEIAKQITEQGGDYVFCVKGNQGNTHKDIKELFAKAQQKEFKGYKHSYYETREQGHGREEIRRYWTLEERPLSDVIGWIWRREPWAKLNMVGMVEAERVVDGKRSKEIRYYISSLENDAKVFAHAVRNHWSIENGLHWVLDVAFREDENRARMGNSQANLSLVRHIALNLLKQEKSKKVGVAAKRSLLVGAMSIFLKYYWNDLMRLPCFLLTP